MNYRIISNGVSWRVQFEGKLYDQPDHWYYEPGTFASLAAARAYRDNLLEQQRVATLAWEVVEE